jgi:dihydromonapterin reductase/dihydrofolate reductase
MADLPREPANIKAESILITGVSRRLGLALAEHFLSKGFKVIGTYRTERSELFALFDQGATLYQVDFNDRKGLDNFIEKLKENHTHLRAIIHNSSDWIPESSALNCGDIFDQMMTVHAKAPYLINHAMQEPLTNNGKGDIIHISDYVAAKGSKKHIAYAASKAALENLSLSFAAAFAPSIKVNTIAPALLKFNEGDDEAYRAKALSKALLPIEGSFEEAIATVEYIMNSRYITGRTLNLDGGRHLK